MNTSHARKLLVSLATQTRVRFYVKKWKTVGKQIPTPKRNNAADAQVTNDYGRLRTNR